MAKKAQAKLKAKQEAPATDMEAATLPADVSVEDIKKAAEALDSADIPSDLGTVTEPDMEPDKEVPTPTLNTPADKLDAILAAVGSVSAKVDELQSRVDHIEKDRPSITKQNKSPYDEDELRVIHSKDPVVISNFAHERCRDADGAFKKGMDKEKAEAYKHDLMRVALNPHVLDVDGDRAHQAATKRVPKSKPHTVKVAGGTEHEKNFTMVVRQN